MRQTPPVAGQPSRASGAAGAGVRLRLPPLWRVAPRRVLREPLTLVLVTAVLALVGVAASAGPLYAEAVSDASLHLALDAVPAGSAARAAPVVRVNGGVEPAQVQQNRFTAALADVPGLGPTRVTLQSVSTELNPRIYFDPVGPVLTVGSRRAPVRLFGVEDVARRLVPAATPTGPTAPDGIWLPAPVAEELGLAPGDAVPVSLTGWPEPKAATATVAGTYAVEEDGRTPRSPAGEDLWDDLEDEGYPTDAISRSLRAHLVVADLRTVAVLSDRIEDDLLWSAQARVDPARPRLADLDRTAEGVADLRRALVSGVETGSVPPALRAGLASGVEDITDRAHELADAAGRGAAVTTGVGIALALALVVAAARWSSARRRREVRLLAGTGRRPVSAALLHVVELVPAAVLGGALGWGAARVLVDATVGSASPSHGTILASVAWCVVAMVAALVLSGAVVAVATRGESRRLEGRADLRVPWVLVLVVLAVASAVGLATRPPTAAGALGPLDVLVPPLVIGALAAVGSRAAFLLMRRTREAARPPTRRTVAGWLARRRLRAPDPGREVATTIAATGVAMLVLSLASLVATERTVEDRAAVRAGTAVVHLIGASWRVDPGVAQQAEPPKDDEAVPVPVARTPQLPRGQTVAWTTQTTVATSDVSVRLLIVDPAGFGSSAVWGTEGGPVDEGRAILPDLAASGAESAATTRRNLVGAAVPAVLVGPLGDLDLAVGDAVTVDTLSASVRLEVRHVLTTFPGSPPGTLVVPSDAFFATQLNDDPRLRPTASTRRNRPVEFQTYLWSSNEEAARATLTRFGLRPSVVTTLAGARATPSYVAATQARRYQVALGVVFGCLGAAAVVLGAVRLARRSPAADLMLAWAGAGRRSPAVARAAETAVVLALGAGLAVVALLVLRPAGAVLLEPGDGIAPAATLGLPPVALVAGLVWLVVTAVSAAVGMRLASAASSPVEVLRGED